MTNQVTFRNNVQAVLFENELRGQISDGYWETASPMDHWKVWCNAEIKVGENVGRNFFPRKDNYSLTSNTLLDIVGQRMLSYAKLAHAGIPRKEIESYASLLIDIGDGSIADELSSNLKGEYWDEKRAKIESLKKYGILQKVKAIVEDETAYTMKDMKNDLKEMRKILKTHNG